MVQWVIMCFQIVLGYKCFIFLIRKGFHIFGFVLDLSIWIYFNFLVILFDLPAVPATAVA